jgi:RNase P/RNase MRP subunit POP5
VYNIIKNRIRQRYIGFIIKSSGKPVTKYQMIGALKKQCSQVFDRGCRDLGIYVVRFDGRKGIVRCNHVEKENTIKLLRSIDYISSQQVEIITVGTSGTIRSLVKKHMNNIRE